MNRSKEAGGTSDTGGVVLTDLSLVPPAKKERPPVSLSKATHCRMELWLLGHGYEQEPVQPGTQRTFNMGTIIETALLRTIRLVVGNGDSIEEVVIGPWWDKNVEGYIGEVKDFATGKSFVADISQLSDFQREVSFAGFKGHIDAILTLDTGRYVLDTKSAAGFGYDRALTGNLHEDIFAREYIGQLHAYAAGLKAEGEKIDGMLLVYFNKENSQVCCRFIDYDQAIVDDISERLAWANNPAEPVPDWEWTKDAPIPLRCGYCSLRQACSEMRGVSLEQTFNKKNKPVWIVR